jgi:hypothetical protein
MIRIDKRPVAEIKEMIEWVQRDPFWWPNVLSPAKLRKQWDQLEAKRLSIKPVVVDKTDYSFEALVEAMR